MAYISPIRILGNDAADALSGVTPKALLQAKKILLAEAELNPGKTVVINGKELSKEDIIAQFDRLDAEPNLDYHLLVYRDKALLNFLEEGGYAGIGRVDTDAINANPEYKRFLRPYVHQCWAEAAIKAFRKESFKELVQLLSFLGLFANQSETIYLLEPLEQRLHDFNEQAVEYNETITANAKWDDTRADLYFNNDLIAFLNALPLGFGGFRNTYMITLVNLTVHIYNAGSKGYAIAYGQRAMKLDCDDSYKAEMESRMEIYKGNTPVTASSEDGAEASGEDKPLWKNWWFYFVIIAMLRVLLTLENCGGGSSNNYYKTDPDFKKLMEQAANQRNWGITPGMRLHADMHASNYMFARQLVDSLDVLGDTLVTQPEDTITGKPISSNQLRPLRRFVNKHWDYQKEKTGAEEVYLPVLFNNHSDYDCVVLYITGGLLLVEHIPAHGTDTLHTFTGTMQLVPYLGKGWGKTDTVTYMFEKGVEIAQQEFKAPITWFATVPGHRMLNQTRVRQISIEEGGSFMPQIEFGVEGLQYSYALMGSNIALQ